MFSSSVIELWRNKFVKFSAGNIDPLLPWGAQVKQEMRNITYPTLCFKDCSLIQAFLVFSQFAVFGIISILDSHSITDCHMAFAGRYMLTILLQEGTIPMDILKKKSNYSNWDYQHFERGYMQFKKFKKNFPFDLSENIGSACQGTHSSVHFLQSFNWCTY